MQPGDRVRLIGLVTRSELNEQQGTVTQVGSERATVRLDSGLTVSAMHSACRREPDQHQDPNREPDEPGTRPPACTSPHILALASTGLVAAVCTEPTSLAEQNQDSSLAGEAPTMAAHALDSLGPRLRYGHGIPPMDWGPDPRTPAMFMAEWARRIAAQDQAFATQTGGDVHEYFVHKLFYTMKTIRGPRQWGWKFLNAGASQCVCCFVYADGSPTQLLPLGESRSAQECWWPCLVLWEDKQAVFLCCCPALAWANARPWGVHVSRVRSLM